MSGEVSCLVWRFCRVRVLSASEHVEKKLWSKHEIVKSSKWNEFYGEWLALFWYILMIFWCKAEMLLVIPVVSPQKLFLRYRLCLAMITTCRESGLVELDMESARFGWPVGERPLFLTHKTSNWAAFYWILKRIDICAAAPKRVELYLSLVSRDKRTVITYHWVLLFSISTANEVCSWFDSSAPTQSKK